MAPPGAILGVAVNTDWENCCMHSLRLSVLLNVVLLACLLAKSGCESGDEKHVMTGTVSGRVVLDGKPVKPGCVLTFLPVSAGADLSSGLVLDDGSFVATSGEISRIPVGEYRVIVSPPPLSPDQEEELTKKNSQAVMNALIKKSKSDLEKVEYPQDAIVPRKYWRDTTSGLKLQVKEGANSPVFELSSNQQK